MKIEYGEQSIFKIHANFGLDQSVHVRTGAKNVRARTVLVFCPWSALATAPTSASAGYVSNHCTTTSRQPRTRKFDVQLLSTQLEEENWGHLKGPPPPPPPRPIGLILELIVLLQATINFTSK